MIALIRGFKVRLYTSPSVVVRSSMLRTLLIICIWRSVNSLRAARSRRNAAKACFPLFVRIAASICRRVYKKLLPVQSLHISLREVLPPPVSIPLPERLLKYRIDFTWGHVIKNPFSFTGILVKCKE